MTESNAERITITIDGDVSKPRKIDLSGFRKAGRRTISSSTPKTPDSRKVWPEEKSLTDFACMIFAEWNSGKHGPKTSITQREVFRRGIERYQFPGRKPPTPKRLQDLNAQRQNS